MVTYGGAAKEWFEQADAFESVVVGKTLDEIKALVAEGGKGTDAVISAGCTITITEFVGAIEKAFANLADSNATASSTLTLGMNTAQSTKDATADANGQNQVETTIVAAAIDADGKVLVAASDCVQVKFTFDAAGVSTYDATKAAQSKRELGANYGMVAYGNAAKEWFEQADAFNALCVGKTVAEIVALCGADNYGTDEVKTAGCTILVDGFTKAADKLDKSILERITKNGGLRASHFLQLYEKNCNCIGFGLLASRRAFHERLPKAARKIQRLFL